MPQFSVTSRNRLATCHVDLQRLFDEVIRHVDVTILEGHRGAARQNELVDEGLSQLRFPASRHNASPSLAVDVAPWPINWDDTEAFIYLGGYVKGMAAALEIPIRWGGDWNRNHRSADESFRDLVHFELDS